MPRFRNSLKPDYGRTILGLLPVPDAARRFEEVKRCAMDAPCGAVLRSVLLGVGFELFQCLNGHTHRTGAPAPPWQREPGQRHESTEEAEEVKNRRCPACARVRRLTRLSGGARVYCLACKIARRKYQRALRASKIEAG